MIVTLHIDIKDGSRAIEDKDGWKEIQRIATVTGLAETDQGVFEEAGDAAGMPQTDSAHPAYNSLRLDERSFDYQGGGVVKVTLTYRRQSAVDATTLPGTPTGGMPATIQVGTTVRQTEANTNINGVALEVDYNAAPKGEEQTQIATTSRMMPASTLTVTRREAGSPASKSREYVGTVNLAGWLIDPSAQERSWLCTGINGQSIDGGHMYEVTYTFEHCGQTPTGDWDSTVYWRSSAGKIPAWGTLTAGWAPGDDISILTSIMYPSKQFNNLGL